MINLTNIFMNAQIMDVTLRDGSYAVNFQFSEHDTKKIGSVLEQSGVSFVEIGHGQGLNASNYKNGIALCTDEEYLASAQEAYQTCKYGMFCIPGIARLEDLNLLKKYGASFVRIGCNIDQVDDTEPFVKRAKELGLIVAANYMKSYTATEQEFELCVKKSMSYGVDYVYIVDSAGYMLPEDIKKYYDVVKRVDGPKVGFHGHNNLGLAVSNSLYAAELGFDLIDTSLQGLGRSAGNTSTELFVSLLYVKYGIKDYDIKSIVKFSENYVKPLVRNTGVYGLDIFCGIAGFHSSYMKYIHRVAAKYEVNPYELIVEYCKIDKINMDENLLVEIAKKLPKEDINLSQYGFDRFIGDEQKMK
jgi:4-hydroxy-2-oxovalerate aldolase